jgi:hypothetical protein
MPALLAPVAAPGTGFVRVFVNAPKSRPIEKVVSAALSKRNQRRAVNPGPELRIALSFGSTPRLATQPFQQGFRFPEDNRISFIGDYQFKIDLFI